MKSKYVIVSDEKEMKFFQVRVEQHENNRRVALDLLSDFSSIDANRKVSDIYSDKMGDFKDSTKHGGGTSEPKIDIEREKQHIRYIAEQLKKLQTPPESEIYISAPHTILKRLQEEIPSDIQKKVRTFLPKNLVHLPADKILNEFEIR